MKFIRRQRTARFTYLPDASRTLSILRSNRNVCKIWRGAEPRRGEAVCSHTRGTRAAIQS